MRAVVLCGGSGNRLRPYTFHLPKPLLPIGGKPILQYVLENIKRTGITEVILTVGTMHEKIQDYFKDGSELGLKIEYSVEKEKLDTAGSIVPIKDKLNEDFLVAMGDHITDIDLSKLIERHRESGAIATLALLERKTPMQFGIAELEAGFIKTFKEKPLITTYINCGIAVFKPEIFKYINEKEDFSHHVYPRLLENNEKIAAYVFDSGWYDVGTVAEYKKLRDLFDATTLVRRLSE